MIARSRPYWATPAYLVMLALLAACGGAPAATTPPFERPELAKDHLGLSVIGDPPQAVIEELTGLFGAPDEDSGWISAESALYGPCPGLLVRAVGWGSLYLFFTADEAVDLDNEHLVARFFSYSYGYDFRRNEGATDPRDLDLTTTSGIGLGSTRSELRTAYGNRLTETYDESADTWIWSIDEGDPAHLTGLLSGPSDQATVGLIETVPGCGADVR